MPNIFVQFDLDEQEKIRNRKQELEKQYVRRGGG